MSSTPRTERSPADDPLVGQKVGKYEIVRVIGRGGMGTVYEAVNTGIGKRVAMKFVDPSSARNKDAVARFQREAQAASAVESAHIVTIFDSGETEAGLPFIVMELLRGEDLGHRIKRLGRLELAEALHITAQLLRGLARAHEAGIVHRDLKPDNVFLVDRDDEAVFAKILDFGISKIERRAGTPSSTLTREGTVLGTPFYMSPEQAQALPDVDGRTDLWSTGAILYECLTGRPPQSGASYEQVIVNICTKDADDVRVHNPIVPEGVAKVIARALSRDRAERFATARELLEALAAASGGVISYRSGAASGDEATSGPRAVVSFTPDPGVTPRPATPKADDPMGLAPTLDASGSKVGWSTSGRAASSRAARERKFYATVALVGLLAVSAGAFVLTSGEDTPAVDAASPPAATAVAEVRLVSNVPEARFVVDGKPVEGGTLRGHEGETKLVRVEAEGYAPVEQSVALDRSGLPRLIALGAKLPVVQPATSAEPEAEPKSPGKKPNGGAGGKTTATATARPSATAVAPTPTAKPTGIAGGLQLKEN